MHRHRAAAHAPGWLEWLGIVSPAEAAEDLEEETDLPKTPEELEAREEKKEREQFDRPLLGLHRDPVTGIIRLPTMGGGSGKLPRPEPGVESAPPIPSVTSKTLPEGPFGSIIRLEGVRVRIAGRSAQEFGYSYEKAVRAGLGSGRETGVRVPGVGQVDDIIGDGDLALEMKFVNDYKSSIYNTSLNSMTVARKAAETVEQMARISDKFERIDRGNE